MVSGLSDGQVDVAILNARIYGAPGEVAHGDAIGIREGRVAAIGTTSDLRRMIGPRGRVVDVGGRTILPAFIDSHTHFHRGAILQRFYLDFETLRPASVDDVLTAVRDRAQLLGDDEWVQGDGLSAPRLAEGRLPDRHELDRASPRHPTVLRGIGKHVVAANSAALAAAGIDRQTPDPPGGRIERAADGEPTGILHERAKLRLDQSDPTTPVPRPSPIDRREALRSAFAGLHAKGIATIHEMVRLPEEADDYAAIRAEGGLGVRVRLYYRVHESPISLDWLVKLGIRRGLGDAWLRILGVKVSVDGFCIFRNAAVHEPYRGEPNNLGLLRIEPGPLQQLVSVANRQGLNVAVHAVGARAVDQALDAFEAAGPAVAGPHRLEHGYVDVDDARLERARRLELAWSVQPAFLAAYAREWTEAFGESRTSRIMPLRTGAELGLPLLFNSDFPCVPFDPLDGIRAAVAGPRMSNGRDQSVDLVTAWRAFTTTPATIAGEPAGGRLERGAAADLIVIDGDPFADGFDLAAMTVRATMVAGDLVHGGGEFGG
ncbi:MAG TPA: amidohydrolase [Vitreimonas sp.]|nr:amidohydrolase [Vitreimonas sp.]